MRRPPRRIGILGGTFDPIHCGHLDVGQAALDALELSALHVIASNVPPHRPQPAASSFHRFAMVALAISERRAWIASDLELRATPPSYTSTTLRTLHERGYGASELFFVIGADAFVEIGTWRDYPAILDAAHFAVVSRPGLSAHELPDRLPALAPRMVRVGAGGADARAPVIFLIDRPTADVSSSAIRQRRGAGEPIAGLVPPLVEQHIERHGLYASNAPAREDVDTPVHSPAGRLHGQD